MPELDNKVLVVVGGTSGLGLSASLAITAAGGKVIAVGRDDEHLAAAQSKLIKAGTAIAGDVTDPHIAENAISQAISMFGRFDGLYHVAGGSARKQGDGPLHDLSDAGINAALDLNLKSLMYSNRAAVRAFLNRNTPGVVLNLSSVLATSPSKFHFATHAYTAAKAAVIGFTRSCAAYYAENSIRFNVIAPGLVETPMARRAASDESVMGFIRTKQPLDGGRIGQPGDLDAGVVYLLSDVSRFVTGQVLAIDGGWSVSEGQPT